MGFKHKSGRIAYIKTLLITAVLAFGAACSGNSQAESQKGRNAENQQSESAPVTITVGKAEAREIPAFVPATGSLVASETSNIAPKLCSDFQAACLKGDYASALAIQDRLMPLHTAIFLETNPSPTKFALAALGRMQEEVRLPMIRISEKTRGEVRAAMVHAGLLNA